MGGPIEEALPRMDVEVSLLEEDGTLGSSADAFLDRVISPLHGVAFERKGLWRYKLPSATARDGGGARGFARLFEEQGYPPEAAERPDVRLYRLVVSPLAVSPAPLSGSGSLGAEVDALEAEARGGSPR
jgi:hypothetical protein